MKKAKKFIVIILVIAIIVSLEYFYNQSKLRESTVLDEKYFSNENHPVNEVLYVKKFYDDESVAVCLVKNKADKLQLYVLENGWQKYSTMWTVNYYTPDEDAFYISGDLHFADEPTPFQTLNTRKHGKLYYCLFMNPTTDTVVIDDEEIPVFTFDYEYKSTETVCDYSLGFYCGLVED